MVGISAGELLNNNYFLDNLNAPNEIKDPLWCKPSKIIGKDRLPAEGGIACVDFTTKHNIEYVQN